MAKPARELVQIVKLRSSDRAHLLALLASKPDLLAHNAALKCGRCDNQDEVLDGFGPQRLFDLAPPIAPTLKGDDVLPERKPFGFEIMAEGCRKRLAVLAGVGDENTRAWLIRHGDELTGSPTLAGSCQTDGLTTSLIRPLVVQGRKA